MVKHWLIVVNHWRLWKPIKHGEDPRMLGFFTTPGTDLSVPDDRLRRLWAPYGDCVASIAVRITNQKLLIPLMVITNASGEVRLDGCASCNHRLRLPNMSWVHQNSEGKDILGVCDVETTRSQSNKNVLVKYARYPFMFESCASLRMNRYVHMRMYTNAYVYICASVHREPFQQESWCGTWSCSPKPTGFPKQNTSFLVGLELQPGAAWWHELELGSLNLLQT